MPWTKPESGHCFLDENENSRCMRRLTYREAIHEAQTELLKGDERVFLLGEGIDDASGVFGSTLGLAKKFGKDRIVDTPLAENGMTGIAMGTALAGMRPIFIHMRPDFLLLSLDQLLNHAAKWCYMSNGQLSVPLTIRCIIGRGWGSAAQHSQSVQALLTHFPGIKVVMPATASDAKGLLLAASEDPNPVVLLEHRWLYDTEGAVPEGHFITPLGKANVCREGTDITLVATSHMTHEAMRAAADLEKLTIFSEVIDLRTVKPWDDECVINSVAKTGRLLIADTGHRYGGVAAEVAATVAEKCWHALKAPIRRITLPECPTPAAAALEKVYFPDHKAIVAAVQEITS